MIPLPSSQCRGGGQRTLVVRQVLKVFGYELDVESPLLSSTWAPGSTFRLHTATNGLVTHELETPNDAVGSAIASRSSASL